MLTASRYYVDTQCHKSVVVLGIVLAYEGSCSGSSSYIIFAGAGRAIILLLVVVLCNYYSNTKPTIRQTQVATYDYVVVLSQIYDCTGFFQRPLLLLG